MRKRKVLLIGICMLILTGCGKKEDALNKILNTYIENSVLEKSNIETDEEYQRYEQISKDEKINAEGYYDSDEVDYSVLEDVDAVHVTFATNSYISIQYFDDMAMTNLLDAGGVYLHENDSIYANIVEINNPNTEAYEFSGFEVWEFDKEGTKKKELETEPFKDGLVFQIPMDFCGREISIVPLGIYVPRNIELNDYYKDNNGVEKPLAGRWDINGEQTTGNSTSVSPVAPYTVTYMYNPDSYVFVSSEPNCMYLNEMDGIVNFEEFAADQNVTNFSVELHKKSGDQEFDPDNYKLEHAEVVFKYQGAVIETPTFIPNGSKLEYQVIKVDDGYWIPDTKQGEIEIENVSELMENLVCKEEKVTVTLPQPEKGGTIIYSLNGKTLDESRVEVLIGSEIKMSFECKNGWSCEAADGTAYKVSAKKTQRINVDGIDVNNIFTEQQYKPEVTLTIDKSIGVYTEFSLSAVDVNESGIKLENAKKNLNAFKKEVGTKEDLTISSTNGALLNGEALKFVIEKVTIDGDKEIDIRYMQKVPDSIKVSLYIANNSSVYKTVKINVSKVEAVPFICPAIDNGNIMVKTTDLTNNRALKAGEVIEDSRKVEISISGKQGFYVKDSGKTDIYSESIKYSKYVTDREAILKKHPIKKLCVITLDATDSFGKVTYKVDGKVVEPGIYNLKEEQSLSVSYEITDGKHEIARKASDWITQVWDKTKSKTKETVDIPITSALDGEKVLRDKFISVKNK